MFFGASRKKKQLEEMARNKKALFSGYFLNSGGLDIDPLFPVWVHYYEDRIVFEFDDREFVLDTNKMIKISVLYDTMQETSRQSSDELMENAAGLIAGLAGYTVVGNFKGRTTTKKTTFLLFTYRLDREGDKRSSIILVCEDKVRSNMERFLEENERMKDIWSMN